MMAIEFVSYRKFTDTESAEDIVKLFHENNIPCRLVDEQHAYVKVVGYTPIDFGISININPDDFVKADKILEAYYLKDIKTIDKDYYLFDFTDEELKNVVSNPHDWGQFDILLANKILKEKGIGYSDNDIENKKEERIAALSIVKKIPVYKIALGYILSIIFPPGGMINGFLILNNRNILPNGKKFYVHSEKDRLHGKAFIGISIMWIIIIILKAA